MKLKTFAVASAVAALTLTLHAEETKEVKAGALTLNIPKTWTQEQTSSTMRIAQFTVPAAEGDKEGGDVVVYFFGAGGGGGIDANIQRWIGQFVEEGRTVAKEAGDSTNGKVNIVKITGTYNKPVGPIFQQKTTPAPGSKMVAAIVQHEKGNYFIKCTGPKKTITGQEAAIKKAIGMK